MLRIKNLAILALIILPCLLVLFFGRAVYSTTGDLISYSVAGVDVFRVTGDSLGTSGVPASLVPGQAGGLNIGSSALPVGAVYSNSMVSGATQFTRLAVTANTTVSATASYTIIGITNATAITNLTAPASTAKGVVRILKNETGAGNASIVSTGTFDGAASVNASAYTPVRLYWSGTAWLSF